MWPARRMDRVDRISDVALHLFLSLSLREGADPNDRPSPVVPLGTSGTGSRGGGSRSSPPGGPQHPRGPSRCTPTSSTRAIT